MKIHVCSFGKIHCELEKRKRHGSQLHVFSGKNIIDTHSKVCSAVLKIILTEECSFCFIIFMMVLINTTIENFFEGIILEGMGHCR